MDGKQNSGSDPVSGAQLFLAMFTVCDMKDSKTS